MSVSGGNSTRFIVTFTFKGKTTLSQADHDANAEKPITVQVGGKSFASSGSSSGTNDDDDDNTGLIVGLVVAGILLVLAIVFMAMYIQRGQTKEASNTMATGDVPPGFGERAVDNPSYEAAGPAMHL